MTDQGTVQVVPQSLLDLSKQITGAQTDTGGAQAAHGLLDSLSTAGQGSNAKGLASVEQAKNSRGGKQPPGTISSAGGAQGALDGTAGEGTAAKGGTAADTSAGGGGGKGAGCDKGGAGGAADGKDAGGAAAGGKDAGGAAAGGNDASTDAT